MSDAKPWPALVLLAQLCLAASVHAAGAALEEVVVSGYRQTSPIELDSSLSLFDRHTLQQATVEHFEELVQMVPNMNLSGEGSRARYFQLRGVGEREQYEGAPNPSVGFIVDDIDLSGVGGVASLYDIQQVEVLRGPHSARYGASALAGVVYMRSVDPAAEAARTAEVSAGNDGTWSVAAAAGGALSPALSGRVSLNQFRSNGFRDSAFFATDDTNERDERTLRGKLKWAFGAGWTALLTGLWMDFDNGYDAWTVTHDNNVFSDNPGRDEQQTRAGSLRLSGPLSERMEFISISSLADSDILFSYDGDWGNADFWQRYGPYIYDFTYFNPRTRNSLGQEFRLLSSPRGRLFDDTTDWVVGVQWNRLNEDNDILSRGIYDDSAAENFCAPCLTDRQISSRYKADTLALFATIDSQLGQRAELSIGGRYEHWQARYADQWQDINFPDVLPGGNSCSQFDCSPSANLWGGHVSLSYPWTASFRSYVRIARGFKAGGFNPSLAALQGVAVLGPEFIAYQPETLWNYEAGLKGLWLDGRLSGDLTVFYMERNDAQLSQSSQQVEFDPNSFVYVTYNGAARSYGLEASSSWQLTRQWQLHGSLGLLESRIQDSAKTAAVSPAALGRDLAHAPRYTLNLGALYAADNGWSGRIDVNAMDDFFFDISHNQKSEPYALVHLRLAKQWRSWTLSAWARNLLDKRYATRGFFFGNEPPAFSETLYTRLGDPRSIGLTLSYGQ